MSPDTCTIGALALYLSLDLKIVINFKKNTENESILMCLFMYYTIYTLRSLRIIALDLQFIASFSEGSIFSKR